MFSSCSLFFSMPLIFIFAKYSISCIGKTYSVSSCIFYSSVLCSPFLFLFLFLLVNVHCVFSSAHLDYSSRAICERRMLKLESCNHVCLCFYEFNFIIFIDINYIT